MRVSKLIQNFTPKSSRLKGLKIPSDFSFKQEKTQAYTMLILSLFTISFFGFFALRPTLSTIASLQKQIEDSRELEEQMSKKINQLVEAQKQYEIIAPSVPKIKKSLPTTPKYQALLYDLEKVRNSRIATISGIQIGEVRLEDNKSGKLDLSIEAQGDYLELERLSNKIMANERILTMLSFDITQDKKGETDSKLSLSGELKAQYVASGSAAKKQK